jgi:hypothetical protein
MSSPAAEAMPVIRCRGRLLPHEYIEAGRTAFRVHYRRLRIAGLIAAPCVLAVAAWGLWYSHLNEILTLRSIPVLLLLAAGFGYLVYSTVSDYNGPSVLKQQAKALADDDSEWELDDWGLRVSRGPYDHRTQWSAFTIWGETRATIWLWDGALTVLPKRVIADHDLETLRRWFAANIAHADPPRRGFAVEPHKAKP